MAMWTSPSSSLLLHRNPKGSDRSRANRRRARALHLLARDLPLGLPAIASLGIFQFLWTWNDLLVALTLARSTQPITVAIFSQLRTFGSNIDIIAPATFVSLVIPLAVLFAFQRYFVQGLLAGSVK
jgi:ABC-type maltose transport system permease subunit